MSAIQANEYNLTRSSRRRSRFAGCAAVLVLAPTFVYAQGGTAGPHADRTQPDSRQDPKARPSKLRRLESVTWNPVTEELTWVVSSGDKSGGTYEAGGKETYNIHMDAAIMGFEGERRRFSSEEAEQVHRLMDLISKYAVESTIWWEHGEGEKLDEHNNPVPGSKGKTGGDPDKPKSPPVGRGVPIAEAPAAPHHTIAVPPDALLALLAAISNPGVRPSDSNSGR